MSRRRQGQLLAVLVTLSAFALRVWKLDTMPPGFNDDELSNALAIAQRVMDGQLAVYYVDATGHEALYHMLAAGMLSLFGRNAIGIRLLSAFLGTIAVALTYQMGRRLMGQAAGLLAAGMLAFSFWALVYSRVGQRHISLPFLMLLSFYFFWWGLDSAGDDGRSRPSPPTRRFLLSGLFMGLSFYTYFASRGLPLILLAFVVYLALVQSDRLRAAARGLLLTLGLAAIMAVPLLLALQSMPGADARVSELAVPVVAARAGDFGPLREHVLVTLNMFLADGDPEFLYNIPHRPIFGPVGALFFWGGVGSALVLTLAPLARRLRRRPPGGRREHLVAAFLLLWWLAGISPAFLSVPPASMGHTIVAQTPAYLLAALPVALLAARIPLRRRRRALVFALSALLLLAVAVRDVPDYFVTWPQRGIMRFLFHADVNDVADHVATNPGMDDFAISGLLAGPWEREALHIALQRAGADSARPRWFQPERAAVLQLDGKPALAFAGYPRVDALYADLYAPLGETAGGYDLVTAEEVADDEAMSCFVNGLCLLSADYDAGTGAVDLTWRVARPLDLPPRLLLSKPPPPDTFDGQRLAVFAHLLDGDGAWLAGEDGLWVDAATLHPGDVFRQQHRPGSPGDADVLAVGLYDPLTGQRILTTDGDDQVRLPLP